jgi:hypothetical protein
MVLEEELETNENSGHFSSFFVFNRWGKQVHVKKFCTKFGGANVHLGNKAVVKQSSVYR